MAVGSVYGLPIGGFDVHCESTRLRRLVRLRLPVDTTHRLRAVPGDIGRITAPRGHTSGSV